MKYLTVLLTASLGLLAACEKRSEGDAPVTTQSGAAVARVNGTPIGADFFEAYVREVAGKPSKELTPEQREQALDNLVRARLIAQQAAKDGMDKDPQTAALIELSRLNVLQQAVSENYLKDRKPSEQEVRAEYETQVAALPSQEYRARHILVATENFANKLIQQLSAGANFADVARRESMDSSKTNGGDLGWFTPDRMVKPFADAAMALKPGEMTRKPVQTQYGWHIIRLEEVRPVSAPPFDQVRQRLEQVVQTKKFKSYVDDLEKNAKIEKNMPGAKPAEPAVAGNTAKRAPGDANAAAAKTNQAAAASGSPAQ